MSTDNQQGRLELEEALTQHFSGRTLTWTVAGGEGLRASAMEKVRPNLREKLMESVDKIVKSQGEYLPKSAVIRIRADEQGGYEIQTYIEEYPECAIKDFGP